METSNKIMICKILEVSYSVEAICKVNLLSRQSYYQWKHRQIKQYYQEDIVLQLVQQKRKRQPKLGGRKLHWMLKEEFKKLGFKLGRDRFFEILGNNGFLVEKTKKYVNTTNSTHRFRVYGNLIKDLVVERLYQLIVADITYLETLEGYVYLALITEVFTRMIIGYDLSESLSAEGSLRALMMSLRIIKKTEGMIHHSDRGIQYCSNQYTEILKSKAIRISMGQKGNPYENAIAERVNGILKIEFLLDQKFRTKKDSTLAVKESIKIYNEERPHMSLGYLTPLEKYKMSLAA